MSLIYRVFGITQNIEDIVYEAKKNNQRIDKLAKGKGLEVTIDEKKDNQKVHVNAYSAEYNTFFGFGEEVVNQCWLEITTDRSKVTLGKKRTPYFTKSNEKRVDKLAKKIVKKIKETNLDVEYNGVTHLADCGF